MNNHSAFRLGWGRRYAKVLAVLAVLLLLLVPLTGASASSPAVAHAGATVTVFATGLNNPRGLKFGPDGALYVAEGGVGGSESTVGLCPQVPEAGPYTGSPTGSRVSRIDKSGHRTTVADNFPSSQTNPELGSLVSGVSDVAFLGHTLYALVSGAGCSHGVRDTFNGVYRVNSDGSHTLVANLSAFWKSHPVKNPEPEDFEPDGTPYSMIALHGKLYVVEPNHGELDRVTPSGQISRVVDISARYGHVVPTALTNRGDNLYIGNLRTFPVQAGTSRVFKVTPSGNISEFVPDLTAVLGVAFDRQGQLYVLETTTVDNSFPVPGTGRVVRVLPHNGTVEVVASGLTFPTAMTYDGAGDLFVSDYGFGFGPAAGEILRIHLADAH